MLILFGLQINYFLLLLQIQKYTFDKQQLVLAKI